MPMEALINEFTQTSGDFQVVSNILAEGIRLRNLDRTPTQADVFSTKGPVISDDSNMPFNGLRKRRGTL